MTATPQVVNTPKDSRIQFLVGSIESINRAIDFCPFATTLQAFSAVLDTRIICQIKCKRWGCRHCGPRKIASIAHRVKKAKPMKLITLTVDPKCYLNPREAFDKTRGLITQLAARCRRKFGRFEYIRILEVTKSGWPHYHLLASCPYIPQRWMSDTWAELSGARIVDIRQVKKNDNVYFYVLKYLSKQKYIPWTNRRISWSKNFFPKDSNPKGFPLKLSDKTFRDKHPSEVIEEVWSGIMVAAFNRDIVYDARDRHRSRELAEHYAGKNS